jgi:HK97 gp10 family phage protein
LASGVKVKVEGLRELGERMQALANAVNKRIAQKAVNAGATIIKKQAIANAPKYPRAHTLQIGKGKHTATVVVPPGTLKKNIVVKKVTKTRYTAEAIVTVRGKRKDFFAARYGRLVEYGTVKMAAEPFLRPAFEEEKGFAVGRIKQVLTLEINKATKK